MSSVDLNQASRFVVGLDLGTTNSAMAYVDTSEHPRRIRTFATPQLVAPGQLESRETLPSFHYQPAEGEFSAESLQLPWKSAPDYIVGHFARDHGALVPGRTVASAKSWLCHNGVDRTAELLPWQGAEDVQRFSPVTISARYLEHFRNAWDNKFPEHPLAEQDFVLTLPASFDEVARELTVKAAKQAGLQRVVLIEEPQAAFYAWIDKHSETWDELVSAGQKILVCDVGGGTTDFTLIRVKKAADETVQFHRVAVGDHLILGGDNLDLSLAHHLEGRVKPGGQLDPRQWGVLVRSCRRLKEVLMAEDAPDEWTLSIPGSGSKLIGGAIQIRVTKAEVEQILVDGFFPDVPLDSQPQAAKSGFQEFGLPYASDPAITKYLAAFLSAHRHVALDEIESSQPSDSKENPRSTSKAASTNSSADPARADIVLFNGGVFASPAFRRRTIESLEKWFRGNDPKWTPIVLDNERLDLAVARGAAYYGMVRRGEGVKIAAGLARTYYIGVEKTSPSTGNQDQIASTISALCLLPAGIEPGQEIDLSQHQFQLLVSQPIEFPLFVSSTRLTDRPGDLVAIDPEQIKALPPIRTVLKTGKSKEAASVAVVLSARLTEIGTLDLWCSEVDGKRNWKLLFDVRSATQTDIAAHSATGETEGVFDDELLTRGRTVIQSAFGSAESDADGPEPATGEDKALALLMKNLESVMGFSRNDWPTSLLRQLWEVLLECEPRRWKSAQHEARWLNLTGFSLRPGYGLAVDDWRCNETWKRLQGKLAFATTACRTEWYILWRRVAGGLTSGQQQALAAPLLSQLKQAVRQTGSKGKSIDFGGNTHESSELLRLLGACELLTLPVKHELGDLLIEILSKPRFSALKSAALWALARVGARQPAYGPLNVVVSPDQAARWLHGLVKLELTDGLSSLALMQLARKTGDRYRDIDEGTRTRVLKWMERSSASNHYRELIANVTSLDAEEQTLIFGDSLPKGLRIL